MNVAIHKGVGRNEDCATQAGLQKCKQLSVSEPTTDAVPAKATSFKPTFSFLRGQSDPVAPYGCARATPFLTVRLAKYWSPTPWFPAPARVEKGEQASLQALDTATVERWERTKGQCINAAAYVAGPVDWSNISKNSLQPLQFLQETFDCELKLKCLQQGLLCGATGYDTVKAEAESARAEVCKLEGVYTSAEDGSFSQSLADVNLSKARCKLQKLEQQAEMQLRSIRDAKETMLNELGLFKEQWTSERKKQRCT